MGDDAHNAAPKPGVMLPNGECLEVERILQVLAKGKLQEEHGRLRWSSNYAFLVSVLDDPLKMLAVYKPQKGERPLWDFPDGTLCYREVAAYVVSEAIGWQIVPPTVLRDGTRGVGSLQFYIEHNPEINYFNLGDSFLPQLERFAAFDYITNNADRKGGHCLLGAGNKLWGIDHGICFHVVPKLRTVIWNFAGEAMPAAMLTDIERFYAAACDKDHDLYKSLAKLVTTAEVEAMLSRTNRLLKTGKFPQPGHGPSYPWPPV